jgi:hypothetical protein
MIMRPDETGLFRLIGPMYVNGITLGAAWPKKEFKIKSEIFTLTERVRGFHGDTNACIS